MTTAEPYRPCLYAIYDLSLAPITFDVMNVFAIANVWAARTGLSGYHMVFVLGEGGTFRTRTFKDSALSVEEKNWRMWHVMLPHAAIARNCVGVSFIREREELSLLTKQLDPRQIYPPGYIVDDPHQVVLLSSLFRLRPTEAEMNVFNPTPAALAKVNEWLAARVRGSRPVVITLRTSRVDPGRNSRLGDWLQAAQVMRERGYTPIFVPDTELVTRGADGALFEGFPVFGLGAVDLDLRLALYRRAYLNMADNGGPAFLNYFMAGSTMVCFLPVDKLPAGADGAKWFMEVLGLEPGGDFPGATPARRFVWRSDRFEAIVEEFTRSAAHVESVSDRSPAP